MYLFYLGSIKRTEDDTMTTADTHTSKTQKTRAPPRMAERHAAGQGGNERVDDKRAKQQNFVSWFVPRPPAESDFLYFFI